MNIVGSGLLLYLIDVSRHFTWLVPSIRSLSNDVCLVLQKGMWNLRSRRKITHILLKAMINFLLINDFTSYIFCDDGRKKVLQRASELRSRCTNVYTFFGQGIISSYLNLRTYDSLRFPGNTISDTECTYIEDLFIDFAM